MGLYSGIRRRRGLSKVRRLLGEARGRPPDFVGLIEMIDHPIPEVRQAALKVFQKQDLRRKLPRDLATPVFQRLIERLIAAVGDENPEVARVAVLALKDRSSPEARKAVLESLDRPHVGLRTICAVVLGKWQCAAAVPQLMMLAFHPDFMLSERAFTALCEIGDPRAAPTIARFVAERQTREDGFNNIGDWGGAVYLRSAVNFFSQLPMDTGSDQILLLLDQVFKHQLQTRPQWSGKADAAMRLALARNPEGIDADRLQAMISLHDLYNPGTRRSSTQAEREAHGVGHLGNTAGGHEHRFDLVRNLATLELAQRRHAGADRATLDEFLAEVRGRAGKILDPSSSEISEFRSWFYAQVRAIAADDSAQAALRETCSRVTRLF